MKITPKTLAYITLLVYWGPSPPLYYLWGFLLFFFILFYKTDWLKFDGFFSNKIIKYVLLFIVLFFTSWFYNFFSHPQSFNNLLWSIITYGSTISTLVSLLSIPFKSEDLKSILKFSVYLALFQVFLGYFQMLQVQSFQYINPFSGGQGTGDYFVGTTFNPGIGSFVAIKMALTTLLFIPFWFANKNFKNSLCILILFTGWVLASAIFTLIIGLLVIFWFLFVHKIIRSFSTFRLNKSVFFTLIIGFAAVVLFINIQPDNISYIARSVNEIGASVMDKDVVLPTLKVVYYKKTLNELPKEYPQVTLIGVGPGNYSSRSAWIISGEYLLDQPAYIPITPSAIARKYNISLWSKNLISDNFQGAGGMIHQPFSTWLSIYAEMGLVAVFSFFMIFQTFYSCFKINSKNLKDQFLTHYALGMQMSLMAVCLFFFLENLFEYPLVMGQFFVFACAMVKVSDDNMRQIREQTYMPRLLNDHNLKL